MDAGPKILLKNSSSTYTNPDVLGGFQDVQLLSNDGHHLKINKSVFIANCKMLRRQILESDSAGESVTISTELSSAALAKVVNFLISGIIPCGQLESSSTEAFKLFGISLSKLSFTKVNVTHCDKVLILLKKKTRTISFLAFPSFFFFRLVL